MGKIKTVFLSSVIGVVNIIISTFGAILVRMYFVRNLGTEYLGLIAIFSSILGALLAVDCGVAGSMFYKIYAPIAANNREKIISTFNIIKVVYAARAGLVFIVGLAMIFFLPELCKSSDVDMCYIYEGYVTYLMIASVSYYIILYSFFVEAVQKRYLVSMISLGTYFISVVLHILSLEYSKSYIVYIVIFLGQQLTVYYICRLLIYKYYPFLRERKKITLSELKELPQFVKMAFHTLGTVIALYTDAFLISFFSGVNSLGMYDNYRVISAKVSAVLDQLTSSIKDPMRLLAVKGECEKIETALYNVNFFMFCVAGICSLIYLATIDFFVTVWLGDEYVMGTDIACSSACIIFMIALNYITVDTYYQTECYKNDKKAPIIEVIVNMFVSIVLGHQFGITGVLLGTVAYYFVQVILRSRKICNVILNKSSIDYILRYFLYCVIFLGAVILEIIFKMYVGDMLSLAIYTLINMCTICLLYILIIYCIFKNEHCYKYLCDVMCQYGYKYVNMIKYKSRGAD